MDDEAYGGSINAPLLYNFIEALYQNGQIQDTGKDKPTEAIAVDDGTMFYRYRTHRFTPQHILDILGAQ